MKSIVRMICRFVIVSLVFVSFQSTAGMIGTDQIATAHNERTQIHSVLARADVTSQLQAMGVDSKTAHDRVAALTLMVATFVSASSRSTLVRTRSTVPFV